MHVFISDAISVHSIHTVYQLCCARLAWLHKGGLQSTQAINFSTYTYIALWSFHEINCVLCVHTSKQVAQRAWKWKTLFFQRPASWLVTGSDAAWLGLAHSHLKYTVPFFLLGNHLVHTLNLKSGDSELLKWHVMKMLCNRPFSFENCICDFLKNMRICETIHKGWLKSLKRLVNVTLNITQSFVILSCLALISKKKSPCH